MFIKALIVILGLLLHNIYITSRAMNNAVLILVDGLTQESPGFYVPDNWTGSGSFISEKGLIVTAAHVVADSTKITVMSNYHNKSYDAKVVCFDPENDVATIRVDEKSAFSVPEHKIYFRYPGARVVMAGYPSFMLSRIGTPFFSRGEITQISDLEWGNPGVSLSLNIIGVPGSFGSGVYDAITGGLIGILTSHNLKDKRVIYVVEIAKSKCFKN